VGNDREAGTIFHIPGILAIKHIVSINEMVGYPETGGLKNGQKTP
jgi:hypothetical protein